MGPQMGPKMGPEMGPEIGPETGPEMAMGFLEIGDFILLKSAALGV
jgi:hypothetical protein